jgi:hypothetical protein
VGLCVMCFRCYMVNLVIGKYLWLIVSVYWFIFGRDCYVWIWMKMSTGCKLSWACSMVFLSLRRNTAASSIWVEQYLVTYISICPWFVALFKYNLTIYRLRHGQKQEACWRHCNQDTSLPPRNTIPQLIPPTTRPFSIVQFWYS